MKIQAEIESQKQKVMKLKKELLAEERKAEELKASGSALADAEDLLKQAIARTEDLPAWIKEKFWEMVITQAQNELENRYEKLEVDNCFHFLHFVIREIVAGHKRTDWEFGKGDLTYSPFSMDKLTFDAQNATWHINIVMEDNTICHSGIVLTVLSILPTTQEKLSSIQWMGNLKNWTWGIDTKSTWYQNLTEKDVSLLDMLSGVADMYETYKQDCLAAIATKQSIRINDLQAKFEELNSEGFQCVLEDLLQSDRIFLMDKNKNIMGKNILPVNSDLSDLSEVAFVCHQNFISSISPEISPEVADNPLKIEIVPGKGIKWEEDGMPLTFSNADFVNKKLDLTNYKRDSLKAIAKYMNLSQKGKMKSDIWEKIRKEYLDLTNEA